MSDTKEPRRFWIFINPAQPENYLTTKENAPQIINSQWLEVIEASWAEARIRELEAALEEIAGPSKATKDWFGETEWPLVKIARKALGKG